MASSVSFYIKNDSVAEAYPYVHKKIIVDDVIVYDQQVTLEEIDDVLKAEYAVELQNTLNSFSSSLSSSSFSGDENMTRFHQISKLLATIASNMPGDTLV